MTVTTLASANDVSTTFHHCRAALGDRVLRLQDEPLAIQFLQLDRLPLPPGMVAGNQEDDTGAAVGNGKEA